MKDEVDVQPVAQLGIDGELSSFTYGSRTVRFRTSPRLESYERIKKWDDGYIVVDANYEGFAEPVEDYIDLIPILENLYIEPESFLNPIKEVELA